MAAKSMLNMEFKEELIEKGEELFRQRKWGEAEKYFDSSLEADARERGATYADAWYNKGNALERQRRYDRADECYKKVLGIEGDDAHTLYYKGCALTRQGKFDKAEGYFDKALGINHDYAAAWYGKGRALTRQGKEEKAIECLDKAVDIDPNYEAAYFEKGIALYKIGCLVHEDWEYSMPGKFKKAEKRLKEADECFDKALALNPKYIDAWVVKACMYLDTRVGLEKAIECLKNALSIDENDWLVWYGFSKYYSGWDKKNALDCINTALALNPKYVSSWVQKSNCLVDIWIEKFFELPKNKATQYLKGALDEAGGKGYLVEAIGCINKAIELNPRVVYAKGLIYERLAHSLLLKDFNEIAVDYLKKALHHFQESLKGNPDSLFMQDYVEKIKAHLKFFEYRDYHKEEKEFEEFKRRFFRGGTGRIQSLKDTRHYAQILGIPPDASKAEIKGAYRKLARIHHPDMNPKYQNASSEKRNEMEEEFKRVSEAHEYLMKRFEK